MALAPKFAGHRLSIATSTQTLHTLELYLDYVCPFSAKMFKTVYESVFPLVKEKNYPVQFLFRQQVQPFVPLALPLHYLTLTININHYIIPHEVVHQSANTSH
jgi:hypothetical protein